jgi:hypothetical protein
VLRTTLTVVVTVVMVYVPIATALVLKPLATAIAFTVAVVETVNGAV